ncbi:CidA/LrgA family holin-like protein [Paenibacillus sp. GCM10027628]|uniref:CidA/LrgA family holin-like protein n=1 Tax=Paenibacillus sp. GCM10027628 TaxID=3273413 RepID=UPI00364487C9
MRKLLQTMIQVFFFMLTAKLADACVQWLHLPIPGTVFGIFLLFALLKSGIVRLDWVEVGSKWLLAEMLLFFIPAAVGIIKYKSLVMQSGVFIVLTIVCSTFMVMLCSGLIGQWIANRHERQAG